eukprot:Nk52_evm5s379 gene=Nk52_evmTU5s379
MGNRKLYTLKELAMNAAYYKRPFYCSYVVKNKYDHCGILYENGTLVHKSFGEPQKRADLLRLPVELKAEYWKKSFHEVLDSVWWLTFVGPDRSDMVRKCAICKQWLCAIFSPLEYSQDPGDLSSPYCKCYHHSCCLDDFAEVMCIQHSPCPSCNKRFPPELYERHYTTSESEEN